MVDVAGAVERSKRRNPIQWHGSRPRGGFAQIPNDFVRDDTLSAHARCVGALLYTHKTGFEVSAVSLAKAMNCSRPTATKALKELQDRRWLFIQEKRTSRGTRAFSIYHLHRSRPFSDAELAALQSGKSPRPQTEPPQADQHASAIKIHTKTKEAITGTVGDAERLVNCCLSAMPQKVRTQLVQPVQGLIYEGQSRALIAAALIEWQKRSDARPGLLPHLVSDAIKERNAGPFAAVRDARSSCNMSGLKEFGYHWNSPDLPDGAKSPDQVRAYMKQCKNEWLDEVSSDIELKWHRALAGAVCAANPGVEESEVVKLLYS